MIDIDVTSSTPIYVQIVNSIKEGILKGVFEPGEKLPSVRDMAKMMTLNPNTVQKAYKELEREKVVVTIQGRGTFISEEYKPRKDEHKLNEVKEIFKKGIIEAFYMGFNKEELINLIRNLIDEMEGFDSNDRNKGFE
ncbi:MAG: GntR family transcriptional regulator [Tepidanaerobacter acetatoxydans]|uniref:HTH-type transcriptional repressor YtrA n=1 Tax=Tepidanaerobacter acetatoxydans (strain DSM 21804 / JCM 16047 / Re1) TaxID=1209989 RepID=F4LX57_TEPAE|nr:MULTISPECIES: GntR family transcriptional regulator [Tepidanaerobacter]AEE91856.1 transcriptional regulator, GntR family [Tepidanaerobacter acetatoxydans Re1]NLU10609.1 GntR family transcriptional regulator [Tepidanaerobacter acetatoxydans]CCP26664.1 HTH-type transcriptional repressor YtrA [Tepidanaerobacter acetatoxydans Re1]